MARSLLWLGEVKPDGDNIIWRASSTVVARNRFSHAAVDSFQASKMIARCFKSKGLD